MSFWLPHLFRALGLLAAINSFIDIFFDDGVNPIIFYEGVLLFKGRSFVEPNGIFLEVAHTNFELVGDSSSPSLIIFVDLDLLRSYLGFGKC